MHGEYTQEHSVMSISEWLEPELRELPWWASGWDSTSNAGGMGLIPGWGTKIPHATRCGQKFFKKKKEKEKKKEIIWHLSKE